MTVHIEWSNPETDWDLYIVNSAGEVVTQSASFGDTTEDATLFDPPPGEYTAHVVNFDQVQEPPDDWTAGKVTFESPKPTTYGPQEAWQLTCSRPERPRGGLTGGHRRPRPAGGRGERVRRAAEPRREGESSLGHGRAGAVAGVGSDRDGCCTQADHRSLSLRRRDLYRRRRARGSGRLPLHGLPASDGQPVLRDRGGASRGPEGGGRHHRDVRDDRRRSRSGDRAELLLGLRRAGLQHLRERCPRWPS